MTHLPNALYIFPLDWWECELFSFSWPLEIVQSPAFHCFSPLPGVLFSRTWTDKSSKRNPLEPSGTCSQCSSILQYFASQIVCTKAFLNFSLYLLNLMRSWAVWISFSFIVAWRLLSDYAAAIIQLTSLVSFLQGPQSFATCV